MVEKNTEKMLFRRLLVATLLCGVESLETWQSAALPHPSAVGEQCWFGLSAGRISCVSIGSIASGAAVDRNYSINFVLLG